MKPLEKNNTLVSSVNNTTSFKMKTSAETFEIFSSQIYEHKIRAIVRELACNAHDAHVDAGKRDEPFRIHFPTAFEPYFEVEDFGVGLDDYDIRGEEQVLYNEHGEVVSSYMEGAIYTTYFASTKRESNESIGHLGLGSKSPLSYTRSMTIVARKAGVERHYVCFIGENGEPQTTFNSVKDTDKSNGVSVRFSVAQDDFEEFRDEAGYVLALFRVKPDINVSIDYNLTEDELSKIVDDGALIIDNKHSFHLHEPAQVYCNMGGVVYPVRNLSYMYLLNSVLVNEDAYNTGEDSEPVYYEFDKSSVDFIKTMLEREKRFVINYPLGDLSFMPSREGLSQDTQTKFNFYKQLVEVIGKEVRDLQNKLDILRQPLEAINIFSKFAQPWDRLARNYKYKGRYIAELIHDRPFRDIKPLVSNEDKFVCHFKDHRGNSIWANDADTVVRRKNIFPMTGYDLHEYMSDGQDKFVCFYANDEDEYKQMSKAIRFYMNTLPIRERVFFFYEAGCDTEVFKRFKDVFYGNVEFRPISTLADDVKAIEPTFFEKKKMINGKPKARTTKKNETKAVVYAYKPTARLNQDRYKSSDKKVIVDLSKLNPKTTMYIDKAPEQQYVDYKVKACNQNKVFGTPVEFMKAFGIKTCIVADGINRNRIVKAGVKSLGELIEDFVSQNKDEFTANWIVFKGISSALVELSEDPDETNIIRKCVNWNLGRFNHRDTFFYLYENDETTKAWCDAYVETVEEFIKQMPDAKFFETHRVFGRFFTLSDADLEKVSEIKEKEATIWNEFDAIVKGVHTRYPLLFGVDSDKDAVLEYIELVNAKHNQLKEVA